MVNVLLALMQSVKQIILLNPSVISVNALSVALTPNVSMPSQPSLSAIQVYALLVLQIVNVKLPSQQNHSVILRLDHVSSVPTPHNVEEIIQDSQSVLALLVHV